LAIEVGVDFDFSSGVVSSLAPGERVLVVSNLEPIPSPLEFMAAGCGQVRKKTWKANLPSMSQIRVL